MENTLKQTREIKPITGSETEKNLHTALSAEAQAYLRYRWFELKAKSDGYIDIAKLFETTAGNDTVHVYMIVQLLVPRVKNLNNSWCCSEILLILG